MQKKFTAKTILLILVLTGFTYYGCYEEPTMTPVKTPYSVVRVANFSYNQPGFEGNLDKFNVTIDGVSYGSVDIHSFTNYFDLVSGDRRFVLTKENGDVIFNGNITIGSYEEITVVFDGVYSTDPDVMSFSFFQIFDGYVYSLEAPASGNAKIVVSNVAPNTDTENQIKYSIAYVSPDTSRTIRNLYEFNKSPSLEMPSGDYTVYVMEDKSEALAVVPKFDTLSVANATFTAGMRHDVFITGNPLTPVVRLYQQTPLAARPK